MVKFKFEQMPKDDRLSPDAFYLLFTILSNSIYFDPSQKEMVKRLKAKGVSRERSELAWKQLVELKYIVQKPIQGGWIRDVYNEPHTHDIP